MHKKAATILSAVLLTLCVAPALSVRTSAQGGSASAVKNGSAPAAKKEEAKPRAAAKTRADAKRWTLPRTAWGEPDFQGVWGGRNQTVTALERPDKYAGRALLTDQEIAELEGASKTLEQKKNSGADFQDVGRRDPKESPIAGNEYNTFWTETGFAARVFRRTSLVSDPPDGKIPYKPELRPRMKYSEEVVSSRPPADFRNNSWADRDAGERCITDGVPGMLWQGTGPTEIFQSPGYLVILGEQFRDRRVITTDGRPHVNIRSWAGDARGHWEGDTLVVETNNFLDKTKNWPRDRYAQEWRTPTETYSIVERFTRVGEDTIDYELSVTDPQRFTRPWKIAFPFMKSPAEQLFYEYACHEGNYGMVHLLSEERNTEKKPSK